MTLCQNKRGDQKQYPGDFLVVGTEIRTPVTGATSLDSNQLNYSHQGIAGELHAAKSSFSASIYALHRKQLSSTAVACPQGSAAVLAVVRRTQLLPACRLGEPQLWSREFAAVVPCPERIVFSLRTEQHREVELESLD